MMAIRDRLVAASAVHFAQVRVPEAFMVMLTAGCAFSSRSFLALTITSPVSLAFLLRPWSRK